MNIGSCPRVYRISQKGANKFEKLEKSKRVVGFNEVGK
jgi:hypothetical protein